VKRYHLLGLTFGIFLLICGYYVLSTYTNYLGFIPSYFSESDSVGNGWTSRHETSSPIKITGASDSYLELLKKHGPHLFTQNQELSFVITQERQKITVNAGSEPIVSYSIEPGTEQVVITLGISEEQAGLFDEKRIQDHIASMLLVGVCEHSMAIELQTVPLGERSLRCDRTANELSTLMDSEVFTALRVEKLK